MAEDPAGLPEGRAGHHRGGRSGRELKSDDAQPGAVTAEDRFAIPDRPDRHFPSAGGMEYEGGTVFVLEPKPAAEEAALADLVASLLADGPYQFGDFHDLPMPLWLVRDSDTGDAFRVAVRDSTVRLHVLPRTEPPGLRGFYRRLAERTDAKWDTDRRTDGA
jgi:hypothetical protein